MVFERLLLILGFLLTDDVQNLLLIGVLNMKNIKEYEKEFYFICFSSVFDCSCGTEEKYYGHNNGYCG